MQSTPMSAGPEGGVAHAVGIYSYSVDEKKWKHNQNPTEIKPRGQPRSNFTLITWNVDFTTPEPRKRINAAISYLHSLLVSGTEGSISPAVIVLQEVNHQMIKQLADDEWVQNNFYVTDVTAWKGIWVENRYGTVTLVDRRMNVENVIRLHYVSDMGRDCLFVDIEGTSLSTSQKVTIRIGNTHLESLVRPTPMRLNQLKLAAGFVKNDANIHAGLIAGDMNPIEPPDSLLPAETGLLDAYLVNGGQEDDPDGHTWGYQTENNPFPNRRFDKIFYAPGDRLKVEQVEVIGQGEKTKEDLRIYISDHYGVSANVRVL
ncbi:hypothetical protein ABW20_dc0107531 [Dactylellina cionopaga]|nr:hypothetical protein ABW20_dc0107531 [Dactylellina cionopaga]